jgi:hypothetical protein
MESSAVKTASGMPLTVHLHIRGQSLGEAGTRQAEALVAPVKPLTESFTLCDGPLHVGHSREVQTQPLGVLLVRTP